MRPVLAALREIECPVPFSHPELKIVRTSFRALLQTGELAGEFEFLRPVVERARTVGSALIGMALNGMPLFLVPEPGLDISSLSSKFRRGSPGTVIRGRWGTSLTHACSHSIFLIGSSHGTSNAKPLGNSAGLD